MNDLQFFRSLLLSKEQRLYERQAEKAESTRKFWLNIMNNCVKRRFLESKQNQQTRCSQIQNIKQFTQCLHVEKKKMNHYMNQMQFYRNKYQVCVSEGLSANYPLKNVQAVCSNKLIKFIRSHNDLL